MMWNFPLFISEINKVQSVGNAEQITPKLKTWPTTQLMIAEHKLHWIKESSIVVVNI